MRLARPFTIALATILVLSAAHAPAGRRPQTDPPERDTPGPIRFMLEVEVVEPDGAHAFLDGGTFDTSVQAVTEVERITRDGICVSPEPPPDAGLAATCYPPSRHLRTRILRVWR